jgi:hypothetical protein
MRRTLICSIAIAILLTTLGSGLEAQKLSGPLMELQLDASVIHRGKPVPKWENGWFLAHDDGSTAPASVTVIDRSGKRLMMDLPIALPGDTSVHISDIAATKEGNIAIAATGNSGAGVGAAFLIWLSPAGQIQRVVQTTPFVATKVDFANDGTLWVLGQPIDHSVRSWRELPAHPILRKYDSGGQLLLSTLSTDVFKTNGVHPAVRALLVVGTDRVGLYSEPANLWVEISFSGEILGQWTGLQSHVDGRSTGVGLMPDGRVFVTTQARNLATAKEPIGLYQLDKTANTWAPVDTTLWQHGAAPILGVDQDLVVLHHNPMSWARIE